MEHSHAQSNSDETGIASHTSLGKYASTATAALVQSLMMLLVALERRHDFSLSFVLYHSDEEGDESSEMDDDASGSDS